MHRLLLAALLVLGIGSSTMAQDKPWTISTGVDYTPKYFFRGYAHPSDNNGQPWAEFAYTVLKKDGLSITPFIGSWNNITQSEGPESPEHWNESDSYGGVKFRVDNFTLGIKYTVFSHPNGILPETQGLSLTLGYNDASLWKDNSIFDGVRPFVKFCHGTKSPNTSSLPEYWEIGVSPTLKPMGVLTVSFPALVGLSSDSHFVDDQGHNESLGYVTAGVRGTVKLPWLDEHFGGSWSTYAELSYIHLYADSARAANNGDGDDLITLIGVGVSY